ncbi:Serine/threonine-protein kinase PrkC [Roseimaritima multifibrata]|uniref:Serine/threonine-protein kinase PrkC n=1 Tax=Roseimaritima multifibrata TaxID=1930274 RepID=A0A517ME91_9BACT|nr:serine/threonine-protein kinase [Roseimaritima multifibrata]QDS93203.1 Serine/threonine-protein kinase PrkC [Roseimaritima multifibrata]
MSEPTPELFMQRIVDLGLANQLDVEKARRDVAAGDDSLDSLSRAMQRHGLLTTLQTEKILRGDRIGYFYGPYKVLYLIGAGTFARVYRSEKLGDLKTKDAETTGKDVFAVKVLRKRFRDEAAQLEQFLREGAMGLKLRHPNIVSVYDVEPDTYHPYMAMEFVEGQTLRELMHLRATLPAKTALKIMHDIASGLAHAASQGISHRDMKLSNVLVSSQGVAKLVDFGLAALADRNNPDKIADCPNARAIDYAALERGTNVRKDDPRSDIYFAGVMLYQMLCGQPPMPDTRDRLKRLNVTRFQTIEPIHRIKEDIPAPAIHVVNRAMELDPQARYQSAAEMQADIKKSMARLEAGPMQRVLDDGKIILEYPDDDDDPASEGEGLVVLLVESKIELQNAIRQRLKNRGYRVLVIADPARALERFDPLDDPIADCVVFSAAELGRSALDAFNRFGADEHTADVASILLVDRRQTSLIQDAHTAPHRRMLPLPLKVRELRAGLAKLLAKTPRRQIR